MKSISIITLSLSNNYGAILQTYALSKILKNYHLKVEVLNYNDDRRFTTGLSFISRIKHIMWYIIRYLLTFKQKETKFDYFRNKYIPLTERYYRNIDLKSKLPIYDIYMSGSDQIWNPDLFQFDKSYFLDFAPVGAKKVAYASSFGKAYFPQELIPECKDLLADFSYISVREYSGIQIVKDICGKNAEHVLDPTLLLDREEWQKITTEASKKAKCFKGILCYIMPGDKEVEDTIEKVAQQLHFRTKLPIMRIGLKEYKVLKYGNKGCDITASPFDYIQYFLNAEYVVTNSFHGTAFSVNFSKEFYVIENSSLDSKLALYERMNSFLSKVNAMDCIVYTNNPIIPIKWPVDIDKCQEELKKQREYSLNYLKKSIYE